MKSETDTNKNSPNTAAIILCAGQGERSGLGYNKMLYYAGKKTILEMTIDCFCESIVKRIVLVISPIDESAIVQLIRPYTNISICYGGATRTESVKCGLNKLGHCDIVVIHDGARPYVKATTIDNSVASAISYGSGIVAVPTVDTIKEVMNGYITRTLERKNIYNIQTPQAFRFSEIVDAYNKVVGTFNDDSEVYEKAGYSPKIVIGEYTNSKVTTAEDLYKIPPYSKIGVGFDVHRLEDGLPLIIGGVKIEHSKGLLGHSDADVLTHAIMDALLSAAGLPDIGVLFSNTDPTFKGISSVILLRSVMEKIMNSGYKINSISAVIMAQAPKLANHILDMRLTLAKAMEISLEQINISATTTEQLGIIGEEKGIAASASCFIVA